MGNEKTNYLKLTLAHLIMLPFYIVGIFVVITIFWPCMIIEWAFHEVFE